MIVDAFAVARLTRLSAIDDFPPIAIARDAFVGKVGKDSALGELVTCAWCSGVWWAAGVRVARRVAPRYWGPVAEMLAVAMVAAQVVGWSRQEGDAKDVAEAIEAVSTAVPAGAEKAVDDWKARNRATMERNDR